MALRSAPVVTDLKPIAYEGAPDDGEKNVSFYGQQVPVEPLPRRVSLPSILKPERLSSLPSMERIDEMKKSASRSSEKPLSEQRQQEQKQTEKVLDKIERSLERKIVEDDVKDLKKVLIINKITTRVYIEDARQFKTKVLTSLMTAKQVVEDVSLGLSGQSWALFELCNDFGIERPLRDWEIVTDMLSAWDEGSSNAIVLKKYGYKATLSPSVSIFNDSISEVDIPEYKAICL
jgi:phage-related protein